MSERKKSYLPPQSFLLDALPDAKAAVWSTDETASAFLLKLAGTSADELKRFPQRLEDEQETTMRDTQQLAFENYKTFIETATCTTEVFRDVNVIEDTTDALLGKLPEFSETCRTFLAEATAINTVRKQSAKTLQHHAQVLEILEIPQLMDTCVRNAYYEEALQLQAHVNQMRKRHPNIDIISVIADEVTEHAQQMQANLLLQLRSDVQLTACLKVIGYLRRLGVYSELELRVQFLQARDAWLQKTLLGISTADPYNYITKIVESNRVHLFDIITQYKAVFSSAIESKGGSGTPGGKGAGGSNANSGGGSLLSGWVLQRVADFLRILEEHLPRLSDRFNTVLVQCMYFALSLGRVGMDFRPLLVPLFERTISDLFASRVDMALADFVEQLPTMALVAHATLPEADGDAGHTDAPIAPLRLMAYPILARLTNNLLAALNDLRECAPLAVGANVAASLNSALVAVSTHLADYHAVHRETFDTRDKNNFAGLSHMYVESLVPCVVRCVDAIYPESAFQSGTASVTPPALAIDRVAIARPLVSFCSQAEAIVLAVDGGGSSNSSTSKGAAATPAGAQGAAGNGEARGSGPVSPGQGEEERRESASGSGSGPGEPTSPS
eukprot:m.13208 g.13208  ORF g.13208 m.13208 type:complete len:614 (-) comp3018_c0_seq1:27-1868(-)